MKTILWPKRYYLSTNPNMWLTITRVDQHLDELEAIIVRHDKLKQDRIEWKSYRPGFGSDYCKCNRGSDEEKQIAAYQTAIPVVDDVAFLAAFKKCAATLMTSYAGKSQSPDDQLALHRAIKTTKIADIQPNKPSPEPEPVYTYERPRPVSDWIKEELYQRMINQEALKRFVDIEENVKRRVFMAADAIKRRFPNPEDQGRYLRDFEQIVRDDERLKYK